MTTVTLESIKTEHQKLGEQIAAMEKIIASVVPVYIFPETEIKLAPDEHYAGLILGKDGEESYHLILLPGKVKNITWADAKSWANDVDGALPTRREQALLYANLKEQFEDEWYWSSEQHAGIDVSAWCQYFGNGSQYRDHKHVQLRARAVRRRYF